MLLVDSSQMSVYSRTTRSYSVPSDRNVTSGRMAYPVVVCSSSQLAPRIGLYTASLVSLTDVLIGWCASDCDAPTHIVTYPNKHGEYPPSPAWRASPTWRKQKAFPLPVEKAGNSLLFSEAADSPHGTGTEIRYQDPSALPWSKMATATAGKDVYTAISTLSHCVSRVWRRV